MCLETKRLKLWPAECWMLESLIHKNEEIQRSLGIRFEDDFSMFGEEPWKFALAKMKDPDEKNWWTYLPELKSKKLIIGTCGYKGKPNAAGEVEIGYELASKHRGLGLAKEMAAALIKNAFQSVQVNCILAHTLPQMNESCSVLKANGFKFIKEINDPEDGLIWRWICEK